MWLLPAPEGEWTELQVYDNGEGIPDDMLVRIFDYRAQVYARLFGGSGSAAEPVAPAAMVRGEGVL